MRYQHRPSALHRKETHFFTRLKTKPAANTKEVFCTIFKPKHGWETSVFGGHTSGPEETSVRRSSEWVRWTRNLHADTRCT